MLIFIPVTGATGLSLTKLSFSDTNFVPLTLHFVRSKWRWVKNVINIWLSLFFGRPCGLIRSIQIFKTSHHIINTREDNRGFHRPIHHTFPFLAKCASVQLIFFPKSHFAFPWTCPRIQKHMHPKFVSPNTQGVQSAPVTESDTGRPDTPSNEQSAQILPSHRRAVQQVLNHK